MNAPRGRFAAATGKFRFTVEEHRAFLALGQAGVLSAAWAHPYNCRCNLCRLAWRLVGPEDGEDKPTFGPFSPGEIQNTESWEEIKSLEGLL